jgi:CTP synthase
MTHFIVVVGGVISGVGKGVATASIGRILKEYGFSVTAIKIDPYINCDAGTLRPTEHGEVWVTEDGGEIDQDLGNYERFLEISLGKENNITTGQVYKKVIDMERKGDFLGETVQFIPHIPNEIKRRIKKSSEGYDICLIEVGGTVGDYENLAFLFALKSLEQEIGKKNILYTLVTYLPIPSHLEEMKTKPTQTSIKLLRETGISPDFILCRGKNSLDEVRKKKIETYANIPSSRIISMPDVTGVGRSNNLYVIPLNLEKEKIGDKILEYFGIQSKKTPDWKEWEQKVNNLLNPVSSLKIAIVEKYLDTGDYQLEDSYISIKEALKHSGAENSANIKIEWIDSKNFEKNPESIFVLKNFNGVIIPGGFGNSGIEGKILTIKYCRENNIPFLGLCLGLQLAVVEFARNICGMTNANSTEIDKNTLYPIIDILPEQQAIIEKGGTMRLGSYVSKLKQNTKVWELYGFKEEVSERHRHRYEVNPVYHEILEKNGMIFSGMSPDKKLVEYIELNNHKFFIATQSHPEFQSYLTKPSPLFNGFIKACLE